MAQEMSFAQALTEARQIIVQQSNRIKTDLDRVKAMQETIAGQTAALAESDRSLKQKLVELEAAAENNKQLAVKLDEMKTAKEQGEAVIDRQGQRISQMQETIATLEQKAAEMARQISQLNGDLDGARSHLPTQEDTDALTALTQLLAAKKGGPAKSAQEETAVAA